MKKIPICLFVMLIFATTLLCACNNEEPVSNESSEIPTYEYKEEDLDSTWEDDDTEIINLDDVTGDVTIDTGGTYMLSGTLKDGQVSIDATKDDLVRLVLNGVTITNSSNAAICSLQADKTVIILAEGTENVLADGESYDTNSGGAADADSDGPDAALFSQDDLAITGEGSLEVTGNYNNAIGTKDDLIITGGDINVTAVNDGLRGRDGVAVCGGDIIVDAQVDGIKSNNDEDEQKGFVIIDGGSFEITAGNDGIQAETNLVVNDGDFDIFTGGGSANAPTQVGDFPAMLQNQTAIATDGESMKGLKGSVAVYLVGGNIAVDAEDDAVHSNGLITVLGGNMNLSTGDDGFHADAELVIEDGEISIAKSYEGIEGMTVEILGGTIDIVSSDDGMNAAGGSDDEATDEATDEALKHGPMGEADQFASNENNNLEISGGIITINAGGDGVDSNGDLIFSGGETYISGPTGSGNSALDGNGLIKTDGGVLVAAGTSEMIEVPDSNESAQAAAVIYYDTVQEKGVKIAVKDNGGNVIVDYTPEKEYNSVIVSVPEMEQGGSYELYSGDELLCTLELAEMVTSLNSDGTAASGMNGGPGQTMPGGGTSPDNSTPPGGGTSPDSGTPPEGGGAPPDSGARSEGMNAPSGSGALQNDNVSSNQT